MFYGLIKFKIAHALARDSWLSLLSNLSLSTFSISSLFTLHLFHLLGSPAAFISKDAKSGELQTEI